MEDVAVPAVPVVVPARWEAVVVATSCRAVRGDT